MFKKRKTLKSISSIFKTKTKKTKKNLRDSNLKKFENNCKNYKKDINGRKTDKTFTSCVINQSCRHYKCKNIDKKIVEERHTKLGADYYKLLYNRLNLNCSKLNTPRSKKRCELRNIKEFHNENDMGPIYDKLLECDNKTCAKEKQIFRTNIYRSRKIKMKKEEKQQLLDIQNFGKQADLFLLNE